MPKKLEELNKPENIAQLKAFGMEIMQFIFSRSQENIIANGTSDTGFLLNSGVPPYWKNNHTISIDYTCEYSGFVEYGTGPHFVSPYRLVRWVERKLNIKNKKATSVAFAVANKISKEGVEQKPFLRPAINEAISRYGLKTQQIII